MRDPVFEIAVEQSTRVDLRVHLLAAGDPGSERSESLGSALLAWFGDQFLAHPQLDDLLRLSVYRIGQGPGSVFDSARDTITPLHSPGYLLSMPPRPGAQEPPTSAALDLFLQPAVGQPGPLYSVSDATRIVWTIGAIAPGALPALHQQWGSSRTVVDVSGSPAMLLSVCASLVAAISDGLENGVEGWSTSSALSDNLCDVAYVVG